MQIHIVHSPNKSDIFNIAPADVLKDSTSRRVALRGKGKTTAVTAKGGSIVREYAIEVYLTADEIVNAAQALQEMDARGGRA